MMIANARSFALLCWIVTIQHAFSKDYCLGLESVKGIPKKVPTKAVVWKISHEKNTHGFEFMAAELNMTVEYNKILPADADIVWAPFEPVETPNHRLTILGPEFDIFPGNKQYSGPHVQRYTEGHAFYTALSDWNNEVHGGMHGWKYPMVPLKFAVDTKKYVPFISNEPKVGGFVYFKRRDPLVFEQIKAFLESKGVHNVSYFSYIKRYKPEDYAHALQTARWGIWFGQHESQGFAFQEALSMGVPLIVLDATSMRDEGGGCPGGPWCYFGPDVNLNATSASTWSSDCGERVLTFDEFALRWDTFQTKVNRNEYNPRALMLTTVAPKPCAARLMQLYNLHRNNWCEQYIAAQQTPPAPPKNYFTMIHPLCHYDCLDGHQLF